MDYDTLGGCIAMFMLLREYDLEYSRVRRYYAYRSISNYKGTKYYIRWYIYRRLWIVESSNYMDTMVIIGVLWEFYGSVKSKL